MNIITNKMTKWLKAFAIIFNILAIFDGMSFVGGAFAFLLFACNKNMYTYDLGEGTTIASLFDELGIASRKELLTLLGTSVISLAISLAVFILLAKWFKKAYTTSDPFSTDLVQFLKKIAKFMLIISITGFIIESIIETATDTAFNVSYDTIFFGGLLAMCISYVLAYANVSRKVEQPESPALETSTSNINETATTAELDNPSSNEVETTDNSVDKNEIKNDDNQITEVAPVEAPKKRTYTKRKTTDNSTKSASSTRKRNSNSETKTSNDTQTATKTTRKRTTKQSSDAKK